MRIIFLLLFLLPIHIQAQAVSCRITELNTAGIDKWEKVDYSLNVFEFKDSSLQKEIVQIISSEKNENDSILGKNDGTGGILSMRFELGREDSLFCHIEYSDKPYLYNNLIGCCLIDGYYVQILGVVPYFLTPLNEIASFTYTRHIIGDGEIALEEMGDDSLPKWVLLFSRKHFLLLKYYGTHPKANSVSP